MIVLALLALLGVASASPLWDYVHTPVPNDPYNYELLEIMPNTTGCTIYTLNMTSQNWLTPADSNRYTWWHYLSIVIPDNYNASRGEFGSLWITGDSNNAGLPTFLSEDIIVCTALAISSGTPCAALFQVPNAPIVFTADPKNQSRVEDAIVAFTWYQYMYVHPDTPEWIVYFPMVKAAVRALDTMQDFIPTVITSPPLEKFMVFGASKRGWTTWLTGSVDDRVIAIAPIVMDLLNTETGMMHMYQTLGGWTFAFVDYYDMNITQALGTPALSHLAEIIDPLNYAENLTMPKLVIDATGDEFFQLQDDDFWWGQLPGETMRLMIANAEHSMATGIPTLLTALPSWYESLILGTPRPTFNWNISPTDGSITIVGTGQAPHRVTLRFGTTLSSERRDFRLVGGNTPANPCKYIPVQIFGSACLQPIIWIGEDVAPASVNETTWTYVLTQPLPPSGWRAFLGQLYFDGPSNTTFTFTTQASTIPNTYPFPPCSGINCTGQLV